MENVSIRQTIIMALQAIPGLGGRAYQAFTAPANKVYPYATVKLPGATPGGNISWAGAQRIEVRIYAKPNSFLPLDALESAVMATLNGKTLSGFYLQHDPGGGDFAEDGALGRIVFFETAALTPPH